MSAAENVTYYTHRAASERRMAERSIDISVQDVHLRMAELYTAKASQHRLVAQQPVAA